MGDRMEPKLKLWVEKDGAIVLSGDRMGLLQHVADTGSLAEAARRMGLSYRRAWSKIREMEGNLGVKLVESEVGGAGGGGTHLTPVGERVLDLYLQYEAQVQANVRRLFVEFFSEEV
jgi:molybdate transport system regulatory protein